MADDFKVKGAEQFLSLSKRLKDAGEKELRKELHKAMREAVKPVLPKAAAALAAATPAGLDPRALRVKQVVQVKTGKNPGITVAVRYGKRGRGLGASNARMLNRRGEVRHPLFGDTNRWFNTRVPGAEGWFDDTYTRNVPQMRREVEDVLDRFARRIAEKGL